MSAVGRPPQAPIISSTFIHTLDQKPSAGSRAMSMVMPAFAAVSRTRAAWSMAPAWVASEAWSFSAPEWPDFL